MTAPADHIFLAPSSPVSGNSARGAKSSPEPQSGHDDVQAPFSRILEKTNVVQQKDEQGMVSMKPVHDANAQSREVVEGRDLQAWLGDELAKELPAALIFQTPANVAQAGTSGVAEIVSRPAPVPGLGHVTGAQRPLDGLPHQTGTLGLLRANSDQVHAGVHEPLEISRRQSRVPHVLPTLDQVNIRSAAVPPATDGNPKSEEPFGESSLRLRPLLTGNSVPLADGRFSPVATAGNPDVPDIDLQRVLSTLEGTGKGQTIDSAKASASGLASSPREDLLSQVFRSEGDFKVSTTGGSASQGDTGLLSGGNGMLFGNSSGSGQTQLFDSSPGTIPQSHQGQSGIRAGSFEDRLQLLNATVPHRLQIDVQLSEASRVQVDVGVQHRQVYAGVLLDNPVLRSLIAQNVQELESQLGQADMELEEFDVYGDGQLPTDQPEHEHKAPASAQDTPPGTRHVSAHRHADDGFTVASPDPGWHLIA